MKNAIILHGRPSKQEYFDPSLPSASNDHWYPWLQKQLLLQHIKADTPEVINAYAPTWDVWVKEVERFDITTESILIGHSTGGGFWVRYLSEHPEVYVDTVVLVAPWLNVKHEESLTFFDFDLDPGIVIRSKKFIIFVSDSDAQDIKNSIGFLKDKLPEASFKDFHNYGHFCYEDLQTDAFPELLRAVL